MSFARAFMGELDPLDDGGLALDELHRVLDALAGLELGVGETLVGLDADVADHDAGARANRPVAPRTVEVLYEGNLLLDGLAGVGRRAGGASRLG